MNPVAFEVFGIAIRWYGIIMATAMLLGVVIAGYRARKNGYDENLIIDLALIALPVAVICARLYYVAFEWEHYAGDLMKIINVREGGLAIHGGVIGGVLAGVIFTKVKKVNTWKLADIAAPSIILGQAIGRWGNFVNQEAHGGPTNLPWGIMVDGVKVHPTFLYESIWNLLVFAGLLLFEKHKKFHGELMCLYVIFYSIGRFFIEGLRTDSLMIGPLRTAQMISLLLIVVCSGIIYIGRKRAGAKL
ncbi:MULTISPECIES: prolipoprotein diacylglyceryl transferase [unclassified Fusibacter]|uniref:prolipoprotein diacylglyceryl transferase n=1 Tax=unclassified Fusibacter TaxID=2624464 RepID=UPI0010126E84|nr:MULTISPECIES: prolipoprotein diacylglyceryl transferase [unclassified Fusibacter]MCK8061331.1 prolipoprotein diacylglyceryl transferase [Fusibacter sp. A2]NPE23472.1 prolipoprotein diacylglyceryl transferase [Fusibacter sp. A1]RXV59078.1 prolipoprotein diacylglyceryl transferase [Fusibacter sp. A1]